MARKKITEEEKAQVKAILAEGASRLNLKVTGKKAKWLKAYAVIGRPAETMRVTGISFSSHYRWLRSDPDYAEDYATVEAMREAELDSAVYERACTRDTMAAMFWLKSRNRDRYGDQVKTTNTTTKDINVNVIGDAEAQLARMLEANPMLRKQIEGAIERSTPIVTSAELIVSDGEGGAYPQLESREGGDIPLSTSGLPTEGGSIDG